MKVMESNKMTIIQKVSIITGLTICSISDGFIFGQMSGMIDALRKPNSEVTLSEDDVSWIASTINATCFIGFIVIGLITEKFGRRVAITISNVPVLVMWIITYNATSYVTFMVTRVLIGVCYGGLFILMLMAMAEYAAPRNRAICVSIVSAIGPAIGTSLGHILCLFLHWRTVALIGIIPTGLSTILPLTWVESPSWLAAKGRFDECEKSFRKLHRMSEATEAELMLLLTLEKKKQNEFSKNKEQFYLFFTKLKTAAKRRYFWKINMIAFFIIINKVAGGRILFSTMAITMLQEITGSSYILFFTLMVDGFIILGSVLSCFFLKSMRMRTLLFSFGFTANAILIMLGLCLYFLPKNNSHFAWVTSAILAFYFIVSNAGPNAVVDVLISEIYPLEFKHYLHVVIGGIAGFATFMSVKLAPSMFATMGYHGVFLINAGLLFISLIYFWINLPETKSKTMQEIELLFRYNDTADVELVSSLDQSISLYKNEARELVENHEAMNNC